MRKIIVVLVSALAAFVGTLFIIDRYVMNKAISTTDNMNEYFADELANDFDNDTHLTEEAVTSFLSGNFICHVDSSTGAKHFTILSKNIPGFPMWFSQNLKDFLEVNPYFRNAIFLIDEDVCQSHHADGYTSSNPGGGEIIKGQVKAKSFNYDFMHAKSYNSLKSTLRSQWRLPSLTSPMMGKLVSYYVPVSQEDGSFFGVFVLNLDINLIRDKIIRHLPYGKENSQMIIADSSGNVISSFPQEYEKYLTIDSLRKTHVVEYVMYKRILKGTKWIIYTFCNPVEIYRDATYLRWVMIFISVIGFALVLICFFIIYRQVYSNLRAKARAEEEIEVAAKVQMSMLKKKHFEFHSPQTSNLITLDNVLNSAKSAGGDLYDYIQIADKLIFCIGDVSGKGLPAALFMTQVVSLFRNAVSKTQQPAEIVSDINDTLAENNPQMTFCTFFCCVLEGNTLTYCNAGHNQPVFIPQASNLQPSYLNVKPNLALGLMGGFKYAQEAITLQKGDSLLMYTDGVTEAKDKHHECFGEDRLLAALSGDESSEMVEKTLHSVSAFVNGYEQSDDITIVYLKA